MLDNAILDRSPMQVFHKSLHGGLAPGEIGAVTGRAGTGKSAFMVHIAIDRLLRGLKVVHVSLGGTADHVRSLYDQIFTNIVRAARLPDQDQRALQIERNRLIHCFSESGFDAARLGQALKMDREIMHFTPEVVILDGYASEASLEAFQALAKEHNFSLWLAARVHRDEAEASPDDALLSTVIALEPGEDGVALRAEKVHGAAPSEALDLTLDPVSMLVVGEDDWDPTSAPWSPNPRDCTLYSGGAGGAESAFGEAAEKWGVAETNFSFNGHQQVRTAARYELSAQELSAGDVSLVYVSRRLKRNFSQNSTIRKVLQSLWHQVSRAQQVFVVGAIQEDGTVTGGTGWSVELARMWHKNLWVFDQDAQSWFNWTGDDWVRGVPVIETPHFCGTGTRYLQDPAKKAIEQLFERSFGAR